MNKQMIYNINGNDYMTIKSASKYLGVKRPTVFSYYQKGYFTTIKIDNLIFIDFNELKERKERLK